MGQDDTTESTKTEEETRREALQAKLDTARAAREAAEDKRQKRFEIDDLEREIEREARAAEEIEKLEELEVEHGRVGIHIWRIDTSMGMVVMGRPTPAKYRGFADKNKTSQNAQEQFAREFLLYPDKQRFNAMVSALPGLIGRCCDALIWLAGWRQREQAEGKFETS